MDSEFQKLLLDELSEIKGDIKEIRVNDIPNLKIDVARLKKDASFASKLYSGIGGAAAIIVSYIAMKFDHR